MTNAFRPQDHLIQLPRRVKDPATGQWETRQDLYLEVKWRLCWFRERYPHGTIETEFLRLDWEQGIAICKATVEDGEGGKATGTGTETRKGFEDFVEKSETRAIGRALAALGIGTQFVGEELSEGDHIADAPVSPAAVPETSGMSRPLPVGEEGTPGAPVACPSADEITTLVECARAANVSLEDFGADIRRLMRLPEHQKITKKFLRESMTMAQYQTARAHYGEALRQIVEEDVPDYAPPEDGSTSEPELPVEEPAVPFESSSSAAPEPDGEGAAVEQLRQEALSWGIAPSEVDHVLSHYDVAKCRNILWKHRRHGSAQAETALAS